MSTQLGHFSSLLHRQQLLYVMVFTFMTVVIWVGISVATSQKTTQIDPNLKKLALPLNPSLNIQVIGALEEKQTFDQAELASFPIYKIILNRDGSEQVVTLDVATDAFTSGGIKPVTLPASPLNSQLPNPQAPLAPANASEGAALPPDGTPVTPAGSPVTPAGSSITPGATPSASPTSPNPSSSTTAEPGI